MLLSNLLGDWALTSSVEARQPPGRDSHINSAIRIAYASPIVLKRFLISLYLRFVFQIPSYRYLVLTIGIVRQQ